MRVRAEVWPFIAAAFVAGGVTGGASAAAGATARGATAAAAAVGLIAAGYFLYFFRDPPRTPPEDPRAVVAGADGRVAAVSVLTAEQFAAAARAAGLNAADLNLPAPAEVVRISIFLGLFDVHVNRAPLSGASTFLGYFPGKHFFTFLEKSSDHNQHNSILIRGARAWCLCNQIVGPVCRRVVYWPDHGRAVDVKIGDPIGMMKFGSRLDMYFPASRITVVARVGDLVRAGETVIARLRGGEAA